VWPPPETVPEIFDLMLRSPVLGLLSMDLLLLVNNLLVLLIYLALAVALWTVSRSAVVLTLARTHARVEAPEQAVLEGAGAALLPGWAGTGYLVYYYFLGAFVPFLLAWLLKRTTAFPPSASWWALPAGVLMLVPAPFGLVGLVFAFGSLIPWSVFGAAPSPRRTSAVLHAADARSQFIRTSNCYRLCGCGDINTDEGGDREAGRGGCGPQEPQRHWGDPAP
jgi:hypothetical protein